MGFVKVEPAVEYVWRPQPGPQKALVDCPIAEVFFGGSRGGGKTDGVLGKWALEEQKYGLAFNARMFRRTVTSSEDAIARSKHIYGQLGGKFREDKSFWRMPNGGRVGFTYLDTVDDADGQQGKNLTHAWVEEVGQYPGPEPIDRLFGALRSADKVPVQMILTGNPGGVGQHWIAKRYGMIPFPRRPKVVERLLPDGSTHLMAVIPSRITDNKILLESDPTYVNRLQLVGSAALVRAWLEGDWSAIEGAFFPEWNEQRHVIEPFSVPDDWLRFRSGDWGSAAPFCVGWWAVVGDYPLNWDGVRLPKGALVRYREWYGASAPNVGLKLPAEEVARGIVEREIYEPVDNDGNSTIVYGVLDPAAFASDGGPSIAERMAREGVVWRPADNRRVGRLGAMGGWDQLRSRLIGSGHRTQKGWIAWAADEAPMIYFVSTCRDAIRTLPALQHDKARNEDVDSASDDHAADCTRYACSSRPWIAESMHKPPARGLAEATLDDMWEITAKAKRGGRI